MKILVAIKQVLDYSVPVRVKPDQTGVDLQGAKMSLNPFDEIALEEAVRLKEKGLVNEVIAVSCGTPASAQVVQALRTALAMGADRAIAVEVTSSESSAGTGPEELQPLLVARLLQAVCAQAQEGLGLVLLGKQATDGDGAQVGPMLAALADWPQATAVNELAWSSEAGRWLAKREAEGGEETLSLAVPAVVTVDLALNEPRYLTLPSIMKAKRKPLVVVTAQSLGVDVGQVLQGLRTLQVSEPPARPAGVKVSDVATLVDKLRNEARVI